MYYVCLRLRYGGLPYPPAPALATFPPSPAIYLVPCPIPPHEQPFPPPTASLEVTHSAYARAAQTPPGQKSGPYRNSHISVFAEHKHTHAHTHTYTHRLEGRAFIRPGSFLPPPPFPPRAFLLSYLPLPNVGQRFLLMSVDVRQACTSLRFPARVETVSRSGLSKVHTGDSTRPAET